jgi:hypothetical protein
MARAPHLHADGGPGHVWRMVLEKVEEKASQRKGAHCRKDEPPSCMGCTGWAGNVGESVQQKVGGHFPRVLQSRQVQGTSSALIKTPQ